MKDSLLPYTVGALLYCPSTSTSIAKAVVEEQFDSPYSLALCLEDTIRDEHVSEAEATLINSLKTIYREKSVRSFYLPKIFIRIRSSCQIPSLFTHLGSAAKLITGFILPKFSLKNADSYIEEIAKLNQALTRTVYMMPILECPSIIHLKSRHDILYALKEKLDSAASCVLNVRVGGNDLCHTFGFRRHSTESIHSIKPVADIFSDIITVFGLDYVVSGPVWEYYNGKNWESGLRNELIQDRLCGFIGKTVIHPKQIAPVNEAYRVLSDDLADAKAILNWNANTPDLVSGSCQSERMNEYKTHYNWAMKILFLAQYYGAG